MTRFDRARRLAAPFLVCGSFAVASDRLPSASASPSPSLANAGWTRAAWSPECKILQADAELARTAVAPVSWERCEGIDLAGCEQMATKRFGIRSLVDVSFGDVPSGAVRIAMTRELEGDARDVEGEPRWESIIWDSDAGVRAAWRSDGEECALKAGALGNGAPSLSVARVVPAAAGTVDARFFWHVVGQPEEMLLRSRADHAFDGATAQGAYFDRVLASERAMAFYYGATNQLWIADRATGKREELRKSDGDPVFCELGAVISRDAVLFSDELRIFAWTRELGLRVVRSTSDAAAHDVGTDGTTIAWLESKDEDNLPSGEYASATLMTSPFPRIFGVPDALAPTATAKIGCPARRCQLVVSNGHVVVGGRNDYDVLRLRDGRSWHVGAGSGAVWVGEGAIWIVARTGIVRVPLESLPSGLEP